MKTRTRTAPLRMGAQSTRLPPPPPKRVRPEIYYRCRGRFYLRCADGQLVRVNQHAVKVRLKRRGFAREADQIIAELKQNPISEVPR